MKTQNQIQEKAPQSISLSTNSSLLQRKATNEAEPTQVPPIVHEVLRSPGQPLDAATRAFMEPRFGHDFTQVRVHTDAQAAQSAQAVNALAYTIGQNIVFGTGEYTPHNDKGSQLLAHELVHTIQQGKQTYDPETNLALGRANEQYEKEANQISENVNIDYPVLNKPFYSSGILIQRKELSLSETQIGQQEEYQVVKGETVKSIALKFAIDEQELMELNVLKLKTWTTSKGFIKGFNEGEVISIPERKGKAIETQTKKEKSLLSSVEAIVEENIIEPGKKIYYEVSDTMHGIYQLGRQTISGLLGGSKPKETGRNCIPGEDLCIAGEGDLMWPVDSSGSKLRSTSCYGTRTINGETQWHPGIDIIQKEGKPVYAAASGVIIIAGAVGGYGPNFVSIQHTDSLITSYGHMNSMLVKKGNLVRRGEQIGTVGNLGRSKGAHLHFNVTIGKNPSDEQKLNGNVDPFQNGLSVPTDVENPNICT